LKIRRDPANAQARASLIVFVKLKAKASALKREVCALYLAARDPRTPWYAKVFVTCVIAYALSPIDLIPDTIPLIGYLDDIILLPLGIYLAMKMIPQPIFTECRVNAESHPERLPRNWIVGTIILALWIGSGLVLLRYFWRALF
jgi:uncharacterized membrane protein YkvA (DUF1232 family)